jgi:uncharacterized membrane protein
MKREFTPYYVSRFLLSAIFALVLVGFSWKAALLTLAFFGLFLLYLHSGWFQVDPSHPLIPLRRDDRGRQVQRKALIAGIVAGFLVFLLLGPAIGLLDLTKAAGFLALSAGILTYFITQFILLARA